jgi:hypothetical protein
MNASGHSIQLNPWQMKGSFNGVLRFKNPELSGYVLRVPLVDNEIKHYFSEIRGQIHYQNLKPVTKHKTLQADPQLYLPFATVKECQILPYATGIPVEQITNLGRKNSRSTSPDGVFYNERGLVNKYRLLSQMPSVGWQNAKRLIERLPNQGLRLDLLGDNIRLDAQRGQFNFFDLLEKPDNPYVANRLGKNPLTTWPNFLTRVFMGRFLDLNSRIDYKIFSEGELQVITNPKLRKEAFAHRQQLINNLDQVG